MGLSRGNIALTLEEHHHNPNQGPPQVLLTKEVPPCVDLSTKTTLFRSDTEGLFNEQYLRPHFKQLKL